MNCNVAWTREFMHTSFTKKFVEKDYPIHRRDVLFEVQKSMMPATQPYVEILKEVEKLNAKIISFSKKMKELNREMDDEKVSLDSARRLPEIDIEGIKFILKKKSKLFSQIALYEEKIRDCNYLIDIYLNPNRIDAQSKERREFIKPCPSEDCRGFLSSRWKCALCDTQVCNACHEIKKEDEDHVCKEENVETVRALMKDTKPCPKCGVSTHKISGCSQIWCTECHTAWSYATGKIETGTIHNPHYYEYLRKNGGNVPRAIGDVPCGGMPDWWALNTKLRNIMNISQTRTNNRYYGNNVNLIQNIIDPEILAKENIIYKLERYHRAIGHIDRVTIRFYTIEPDDHREMRAQYMLGNKTEDEFKQYLVRCEKQREKADNIRMVMQTYVAIITDIYQRLNLVTSYEEIVELMKEIEAIRVYTNGLLMPISKTYHCVVPCIEVISGMPVSESSYRRYNKKS